MTAGKDGALSGGPAFMSAVGDEFIDSIVGENIPILTQVRSFSYATLAIDLTDAQPGWRVNARGAAEARPDVSRDSFQGKIRL